MTLRALGIFLCAFCAWPQDLVVDASKPIGPLKPIWTYFGYDEPNYTYTANGKKLVGELAALSHDPVYIRTHFMLATGDGKPSLKWGSTNAYIEDSQGRGIYNWTIVDRILDTYLRAGAKPFVEIGFMPKALSTRPDPYNVEWIPGTPNKEYSAGWSYPPKDFAKWGEVVYQWVRHEVELHGRKEVASWYWEVWNEPDISYWHGTPEEYDELYDAAAAAVKRALPEARVGGPATTGPASEKATTFLRQFLQHCNQTGTPLDFITFHAKGQPTVTDGHVVMGMAKHLRDVESGFRIVNEFPKLAQLPIVLSESDPEGCAACSARVYPQNAYRNGSLYAVYTAVMMKNILDAAIQQKTNIEGMLTWAFEFEGQPYFDGFRTLATNGIDKPVLNVFRMMGKISGERLALNGNGIASRGAHDISVMAWNYGDDETSVKPQSVQLRVTGIPNGWVNIRRFVIDREHSNAWTAWKQMGSPQRPTAQQYADLEKAGKLEESTAERVETRNGELATTVEMPGESVTLIQFTWKASIAFEPGPVIFALPDQSAEIQADLYGNGTRGVVLAHGGRFDKESWKKQAEILARAGFLVLALRFRGDGPNPDGSPGSFGSAADNAADVAAAVSYLYQIGAKTVSAVGASFGGDAVGEVNARSGPGSIARTVFLASSGGDAAQKLKGDKLFIVARNDSSGSGLRLPEISAHYAKAAEPKNLVIVEGSAHAQFLFETDQGSRVMDEILRFLSAP